MSYAIMRFEKIKAAGIGSLAGSLSHTFRSRYTPNAAPELAKHNRVLLGPESPAEVAEAIRTRWPTRHRKDAVGCIEHFIGASPEWFKQHGGDGDQERYFQHAIQWLQDHYGAENVISVVQHNDETTPHLAAYVVPRDPETGNLSAKRWTGGRGVCSEMQTSFHKAAGEPVGLDRGVKGSKAEHMSIARWYAEQANLDQRQASIDEERSRLEDYRLYLEEERALQLDMRESELEGRAQELTGRAESLDKREAALTQAEGEIVAQRAALERQAADLKGWEARRDAWLAEHRPVPLEDVERLSLDLAALSNDERITQMQRLFCEDHLMANAVARLGWVSYETGAVTDAGQRALVEHASADIEQRDQDWANFGLDPTP